MACGRGPIAARAEAESTGAVDMPTYACGCGGSTKGGKFRPGHDAKLREMIERRVGGLLAFGRWDDGAGRLADGETSPKDPASIARRMFAAARAESG